MTRNVKTASAALARTRRPSRINDGLENVAAGLGTVRDKRSHTFYAMPRTLTNWELENMYRGSWLCKRIVNVPADDMTREGVQLFFDDDEDGKSQFAVEQAEKALCLWDKVNEALRWSRLYGGSVIVLLTKGATLDQPLDVETIRQGDLLGMHVLDRHRISATNLLIRDLSDPSFGLPEYYILAESSVRVHHTRVLRFNGQKLPFFAWQANGMWDDSELQHVLDSVTNVDSASASINSMLYEANVDVIMSKGLADTLASEGGEAKITKRYQVAATMKSFNRMLLLDGEETYEKKQNQFTNLDKIWMNFMVDVCGAADIPMTRLFGQSASGLNATGDNDIRNYYDMIKSKQNKDLRPRLEYLYDILLRSIFGTRPEDFRFDFKSLWQISDTEKATIENTRATRDQTYVNLGIVPAAVVAKDLKEHGTYVNLTDEDIQLVAELEEDMREHRDKVNEAELENAKNPQPSDPNADPSVDPSAEPDADDPTDPKVNPKKE